MKLVTAEESRQIDRLSQEKYGVPSYALMTRAGEAVAAILRERWAGAESLAAGVLIVAGKGNNGGDGMVVARRLKQDGVKVKALLAGAFASLKGDARRASEEFRAIGGEVVEFDNEPTLRQAFANAAPGIIVDAIFGTGLNASVIGLLRTAIELINTWAGARSQPKSIPVVAVDISSGVNADTGAIMGAAVKAGLTVTFGWAKFGHVSYPGADYCGTLQIADIGFPAAALAEVNPRGRFVDREEAAARLHPRAAETHKGAQGHTVIVAGAWGKGGAALLSSRAALRTGAGLVTALIPEPVASLVAAGQAELMTEPMPAHDGHFHAAGTIAALRQFLPHKNSLAVGPGIGISADTKTLIEYLVTEASSPDLPLLIDADGLNVLAELGVEMLHRARGPVVLTPHPGEMGRLLALGTAEVNADRVSAARRLANRSGAYCLLKGNRTVIAGPDGVIYINSSGNPGMASPGMGDALSGIIAALLGQRMPPLDALALGVWVHGAAADRLVTKMGPVGFLAGDVIAELPATFASLL